MSLEKKTGPSISDILSGMEEDFTKPFYEGSSDLKAAYAVGVYLNSGMYYQRTRLRTRGLLKKLRYLLDQPDRAKILKIFEEVSKVMIAVSSIDEQRSMSNRIREKAEEFLASSEWNSTPEELTLALMMGFDLYSRLWQEFDKIGEVEDE